LIELFNREIIGYSAGKNKDATLVGKAFSSVQINLEKISIFHTDRGNEFKNQLIEKTLDTFNIKRSLSMKGCPYDNAVAEATLFDYVNWFNNHRIHSSLEYQTPVEYRINNLKKVV